MKFELASTKNIAKLEPYVAKILEAMGFSDALVTDESTIGDFRDLTFNKEQTDKWVRSLEKKLGVEAKTSLYIMYVAREMKTKAEKAKEKTCRKKQEHTRECRKQKS